MIFKTCMQDPDPDPKNETPFKVGSWAFKKSFRIHNTLAGPATAGLRTGGSFGLSCWTAETAIGGRSGWSRGGAGRPSYASGWPAAGAGAASAPAWRYLVKWRRQEWQKQKCKKKMENCLKTVWHEIFDFSLNFYFLIFSSSCTNILVKVYQQIFIFHESVTLPLWPLSRYPIGANSNVLRKFAETFATLCLPPAWRYLVKLRRQESQPRSKNPQKE